MVDGKDAEKNYFVINFDDDEADSLIGKIVKIEVEGEGWRRATITQRFKDVPTAKQDASDVFAEGTDLYTVRVEGDGNTTRDLNALELEPALEDTHAKLLISRTAAYQELLAAKFTGARLVGAAVVVLRTGGVWSEGTVTNFAPTTRAGVGIVGGGAAGGGSHGRCSHFPQCRAFLCLGSAP